jgi:hypothetical protein
MLHPIQNKKKGQQEKKNEGHRSRSPPINLPHRSEQQNKQLRPSSIGDTNDLNGSSNGGPPKVCRRRWRGKKKEARRNQPDMKHQPAERAHSETTFPEAHSASQVDNSSVTTILLQTLDATAKEFTPRSVESSLSHDPAIITAIAAQHVIQPTATSQPSVHYQRPKTAEEDAFLHLIQGIEELNCNLQDQQQDYAETLKESVDESSGDESDDFIVITEHEQRSKLPRHILDELKNREFSGWQDAHDNKTTRPRPPLDPESSLLHQHLAEWADVRVDISDSFKPMAEPLEWLTLEQEVDATEPGKIEDIEPNYATPVLNSSERASMDPVCNITPSLQQSEELVGMGHAIEVGEIPIPSLPKTPGSVADGASGVSGFDGGSGVSSADDVAKDTESHIQKNDFTLNDELRQIQLELKTLSPLVERVVASSEALAANIQLLCEKNSALAHQVANVGTQLNTMADATQRLATLAESHSEIVKDLQNWRDSVQACGPDSRQGSQEVQRVHEVRDDPVLSTNKLEVLICVPKSDIKNTEDQPKDVGNEEIFNKEKFYKKLSSLLKQMVKAEASRAHATPSP